MNLTSGRGIPTPCTTSE
jgi:hypothetical protein